MNKTGKIATWWHATNKWYTERFADDSETESYTNGEVVMMNAGLLAFLYVSLLLGTWLS